MYFLFSQNVNQAITFILNVELKKRHIGTFLAVQWLTLCAPNAGGVGSIPGGGTRTPHAA